MKILIIGSRGFIGSHTFSFFNKIDSYEVWRADVVVDYPAQKYFLIDAANIDFEEIFQNHSFDVCINCAGAASVPDSVIHPLRDYYLNTKLVFNLLDSIRKYNKGCKFLQLSSAAVYGNPGILPINESHVPDPISPYGWHKYQSELICKEFHQVYNLHTCAARIFSAYGPGLKKQIFWDWSSKIRESKEIVLFGTGNESRDFIYIDDLVASLNCIVNNSLFEAEIINIANGEEITINKAISVFRNFGDVHFNYTFTNESRAGDPINWCADINKIKNWGYKQQTSFEEGVKKYIEWVKREKK